MNITTYLKRVLGRKPTESRNRTAVCGTKIRTPREKIKNKKQIKACKKLGYNDHQIYSIKNGLSHQNQNVVKFFQNTPPETLKAFDGNQMYGIRAGLSDRNPNVVKFFQDTPPETLKAFDDGQMYGIRAGLSDRNPNVVKFFQDTPLETLKAFDGNQMNCIKKGLSHRNPKVVNFFQNTPPETLKAFDDGQMYGIRAGLSDRNPNVVNFFQDTPLETLKAFDGDQMNCIQNGLSHQNQNVVKFFQDTPLETLKAFDHLKINCIQNGLSHQNQNVVRFFQEHSLEALKEFDYLEMYKIQDHEFWLNEIIAKRDAERQNYFDGKPDTVSQEQLEKNVKGLLGHNIQEVIKFTQKAIQPKDKGGLGWTAEKAYSQRIDKALFIKEREELRAAAGTAGLLSSIPEENPNYILSQLSDDMKRYIGQYFGRAETITQVNKTSRDAVKQAFIIKPK